MKQELLTTISVVSLFQICILDFLNLKTFEKAIYIYCSITCWCLVAIELTRIMVMSSKIPLKHSKTILLLCVFVIICEITRAQSAITIKKLNKYLSASLNGCAIFFEITTYKLHVLQNRRNDIMIEQTIY